jgi:hypothetical protein
MEERKTDAPGAASLKRSVTEAQRQTPRARWAWNPTTGMFESEIVPPQPRFTMFQPAQNLS